MHRETVRNKKLFNRLNHDCPVVGQDVACCGEFRVAKFFALTKGSDFCAKRSAASAAGEEKEPRNTLTFRLTF
jgi:hypothetical protein